MGQAFFSISVVAGVMIAYCSYLKSDSNIVSDSLIIAFSDLFVSILSGIVLFTTMYQTGGRYDTSYSLISEIVAEWLVVLFSFISGLIIKNYYEICKKR